MRRTRLVLLSLFASVATSPLRGQWQLTADAGASRLQQTGIPESSALTLGTNFDAIGERGWLRVGGLAAHSGTDRWTAQGLVLASLLGSHGRVARWELAGVASSFGESSELPTLSGELMPRVRFDRGAHGGAFGFGAGTIARDRSWNAFYHGQADGWLSWTNDQLIATVSGVRRTAAINTVIASMATAAHPLSYADGATTWRHEQGVFSLGATAGVRMGLQGITGVDAWGSADAIAWFTQHSAVVMSVGRTLDDVVRGVPRTRYASVALRIAARPRAEIPKRVERVGARVTAERAVDGRQRVDVRVAGATRVELMADFTNWSPVPLELIDGVWRLERAVTPGLHRIALRVDGGEWIAPVNLPRASDDLGGVVGLISIP
ncbi:MAG: glycogen-binding domain-containing protein [bacterium]